MKELSSVEPASEQRGWFREQISDLMENRNFLGFLLVFPAEAILLIFLAYPFVLGLWLGFTDTVIGRKGEFIGFDNYASLLKDSTFWLATYNTFLYTIVAVLFKAVVEWPAGEDIPPAEDFHMAQTLRLDAFTRNLDSLRHGGRSPTRRSIPDLSAPSPGDGSFSAA